LIVPKLIVYKFYGINYNGIRVKKMSIFSKNKVFIIAEAGVNHNGSIDLAKKLIDAAVDAKVDAVKFQTFIAENVISKHAEKAEYQKNTTGIDGNQLEMVKKLQLSFNDFIELKKYCELKGIMFLSTPFDMDSISFLKSLNIRLWKIPSGEITNLTYLQKIGSYNEEIILSTGMCTMLDINNALEVLISSGTNKENISVLHCNTEYPTPYKDVNLKAMLQIKDQLDVIIGYSDHTLGIEVPVAAVALGAKIIEKHFTLDRTMEGPDHLASLEPEALKQMVDSIRNIESSLSGSGNKGLSESEKKNILIARKSLHFNSNFQSGHVLTDKDFIALRPGIGISPMKMHEFIGKELRIAVKEKTLVTENCI
jgi:N-acetylneuraminate synthase